MPRLLDKIDNNLTDLKGLTQQELKQLASKIREELVTVVSASVRYLTSNLGVVELTIALHHIFNTPRDKIIWDVGHQSYVHKLLTGRRRYLASLHQYGGLSSFTCRSEHDPFGAGHASTSVSAALGMAVVRNLSSSNCRVVVVIGGGLITGGMVLEALNQAGRLGSRYGLDARGITQQVLALLGKSSPNSVSLSSFNI